MNKKYQNSITWQRAMSLAEDIYSLTNEMPESEKYCLIPMMREAVITIVSNIKEGYSCLGSNKSRACINNARGSAAALESQLLVTERLKIVPYAYLIEPKRCMKEVRCLLAGLQKAFA